MAHFAHMVSVNRLQVPAHVGFYTGERAKPQPVEISFRLYFPEAPLCSRDDEADFIDYGELCKVLTDFILTRDFKLVEFMGAELFRHLRAELDGRGASHIRLWLHLSKVAAPLPGLIGGAGFTQCDLPADATVSTHG
ncbi:MAG: dihydroneopterin aldolase [Alphaproteobacteria bacterium]|nr:dihydroneopterin aldolase [Alphaproteobacteria bacterium]